VFSAKKSWWLVSLVPILILVGIGTAIYFILRRRRTYEYIPLPLDDVSKST